jgi:hypothetical protein
MEELKTRFDARVAELRMHLLEVGPERGLEAPNEELAQLIAKPTKELRQEIDRLQAQSKEFQTWSYSDS